MKIKALLVDDEPLAIERLRQLLRDESDVQIVGECGDELAASSAVRELQPDLVFLDVRLPGVDGFGVMSSSAGRVPLFIVVTAHAQHAPRAFETHAVDFLLKPFTRERFRKALEKAREESEDALHLCVFFFVRAFGDGAELEIFTHGHRVEEPAPLRDQRNAVFDDPLRRCRGDFFSSP